MLVVFASSTRYFGLWRPQAVFGEETAEFLLLVQTHSLNIENLSGRNLKKISEFIEIDYFAKRDNGVRFLEFAREVYVGGFTS